MFNIVQLMVSEWLIDAKSWLKNIGQLRVNTLQTFAYLSINPWLILVRQMIVGYVPK